MLIRISILKKSLSSNISGLYHPYQPQKNVLYQELKPAKDLANVIAYFWQITIPIGQPIHHLIIPDGTIDLIFNLQNNLELRCATLLYQKRFWSFTPQQKIFGVRLYPPYFSYLFKTNIREINSPTLALTELENKHAQYIQEQLQEAATFATQKEILENYIRHQCTTMQTNAKLEEALRAIYTSKGDIGIEQQLSKDIHPRQLRRLFAHYIGHSPKQFAKIVRFQKSLFLLKKEGFKGLDTNYYDQSHFLRNIVSLTGLKPTELKKLL